MSGGKNGQYGGRGVSNDPRSDPVSPSNEAGQDNCRGSTWRRGSGYAAELNTGHDGSLSTLHANSSQDMLSRIETMTLMGIDLPLEAIRRQIASGVDILVHLGRMRDKSRKLLEITEVCGFENGEIQTRPLYRWEEGKGLVKTGELLHCEKMKRAGISL